MSHKGHTFSAKGAWLLDSPIRKWLMPPGELVEKLAITNEQIVMDFGCGPGYYTIELAKKAKTVIAVDLQSEMLKRAQRKAAKAGAKNIRFLQSDGTSIQLKDGSVDLILLVTVFHEIAHSLTALGEFSRILSPKGRLVIIEIIKRGLFPGAPIQNPQTVQTQIEAADFKHQQTEPYKDFGIFYFTKKV